MAEIVEQNRQRTDEISNHHYMIYLFIISAVVFLPYTFRLTYYLDDWYYIYDGIVAGPNIFHAMFSVDRPMRGYFFDIFFSIFGPYPLPYHLGAFVWRLLAGVGAFWLLNIIWSEHKKTNFFIALLFTLYPGYAWWVSGIEYQPMAASLALQVFSVLFTLLSIQASDRILKIGYAFSAILSGWIYIALVDYAAGTEIFRFLCVYLLVSRGELPGSLKRLMAALKAWILYAGVPLGYVIWRVFLFDSERQATDIGLHIQQFKTSPVDYVSRMASNFYLSVLNTGVNAWYKQLYLRMVEFDFHIPPLSKFLTLMVILFLLFLAYQWAQQGFFRQQISDQTMSREALSIGIISLFAGVLPVILFRRYVNLSIYSHYGLPLSLVASILLAGFICQIPSMRMRFVLFSIFISIAALTHSLIAERTLILKESFENFWWQVAWRIPGIAPDTTLVTLYPYEKVVDNPLGLPEAVNLIYFPEERDENPVRYAVSTLMPTGENIDSILMGKRKTVEGYRTHEMVVQYGNILVLSQPSPLSCVRVIDGNSFIVSDKDPKSIIKIFGDSNIQNIGFVEQSVLPEYAFGREPERGWCYYFEKSDLAVQQADWDRAAELGNNALSLGLSPADQTEWFPFIQAYARTGNAERLEAILVQLESNEFMSKQLCEIVRHSEIDFSLNSEIRALIEGYSCR